MLDFEIDYPQWRQTKMDAWHDLTGQAPVPVTNPDSLTQQEHDQLRHRCDLTNFAIFKIATQKLATKDSIRRFGAQLGMKALDKNLCADDDSVSSLQVMDFNSGSASGYIPYTANKLNWHTDGYYNELQKHIRSFLLYCVRKAQSGGDNMLINHELIYIHLYDKDPALVTALKQDDVMTIPANSADPDNIRPSQSGPVFYRDPQTHALQMRYTSRTRSILWKDDPMVSKAISMIEELLGSNRYLLKYTLSPGEGLICNNILHGRSNFINGSIPAEQRLLYRIRSYNRLFS